MKPGAWMACIYLKNNIENICKDRHDAMKFTALLKKNIFLVHEYFFLSTPAEKHDKGKGFKDVIIVYNSFFSFITSRRIIFTPTGELKNELAATAVQITCYDKNGKEVKRVTSMSGEVEEEPKDQSQPSPNPSTGGDDNGGEEGPNL